MTTTDPTRGEVAHYRNATRRAELFDEVRRFIDELPYGDLATSQRALAWLRGPAGTTDVRYAAGLFYVLGADALWTVDDTEASRVHRLLQAWADAECTAVATLDRELRAAHAAMDSDEDEAHRERYDLLRKHFRRAQAWARRVQSGAVRDRSAIEIRRMAGVALDTPEKFDANADSLAVANGLVNLRTGEIRPLRADDLVTRRVNVAYDPAADAPLWTRFLGQVLVHADGTTDAELVAWTQRLVGYGLTGHTSEQVFATFLGKGANGKSVLIETLADLFASISATAAMATFEADRTAGAASDDLARLHGVRLVFASEGEVGKRLSAATIKRITGEDKVTARHLYRATFEFRPRFLLVMASNTKAPVLDSSEGYWRRLRVVPFLRYLERHERDATLRRRLVAEFAGILAWAVRGAQDWYAYGLGESATVDAHGDEYREEMDRLAGWLDECVEVTGTYGDAVLASEAWLSYVDWLGDNKIDEKLSQRAFLSSLAERRGIVRAKAARGYVYRMMRLLTEAERKRARHLVARADAA
jgi:putative DNA primase/helicase